MKRIIVILLLTATILSAFSISVFAAGDDNAQSGDGTTHSAADGFGFYNSYQYLWKVTLFVGKSDQATKNSNLSSDFHRLGTVYMKSNAWSVSSKVKFGSGTKVDYYAGASMTMAAGVSTISDANCPAPPVACGGNLNTVKNYFGSTGTLNTVLNAIAANQGTTAASLLTSKSFTIGGQTKTGWSSDYLLPNGTSNRVPWVIVYEPMVVMHLKDGVTLLAFTATEFAICQVNGWYDWFYRNGTGQSVANLTHRHLPTSVQLEESWFGYPVYAVTNNNETWSDEAIIRGGGWGMRWLDAAVTEPTDTSKDYSVSITSLPSSTTKDAVTPITIKWMNNKSTSGTVLCELYSGTSQIWSKSITISGNSYQTSTVNFTYPSIATYTITAKINYANRYSETNPNNNEDSKSIQVKSDSTPEPPASDIDYGVIFGTVEQPEPGSYADVTVKWKNYKTIGGSVLCELYRDSTCVYSAYKTLSGGQTITQTISVYYPSTGSYTLTAKINYANRNKEVDPNDNMRTKTVEIGSDEDDVYDFSVSNISVSPGAPVVGDTVEVSFISDNWNKDKSYSGILVELLVDNAVVKSEYCNFSAYGRNQHRYSVKMDSAGEHDVTARINWANRYTEDNSSNNNCFTNVSVEDFTEFSVSDLSVIPSEVYTDDSVVINFRTDNWNKNTAYTNIPVQVLYKDKVVYTEYVNYSAYGLSYHTIVLSVGDEVGTFPIKARVNWQEHLSEQDPNNNCTDAEYITVKPKTDLTIEAIVPNSDYREGMTVVTSYTMYNNGSIDIVPTHNNTVEFEAYYYNGSTKKVISSQTWNNAVIPANGSNLVYFKWTVPSIAGKNIYCQATVNCEDTVEEISTDNNTDTLIRTVCKTNTSQTPDTNYEAAKPTGFTTPNAPVNISGSNSWSIWEYSDGRFTKKTYGVTLNPSVSIVPDTDIPSVTEKNGKWIMKSGYGFSADCTVNLSFNNGVTPEANAYTGIQRCHALFPEFNYSSTVGTFRTLYDIGGKWQFEENRNTDDNARLHFTPIWYPDGDYLISCVFSDLWTPAGMIECRQKSNVIVIDGNAYDDHYIGR